MMTIRMKSQFIIDGCGNYMHIMKVLVNEKEIG